jgi:hypothetical protein
MAITPGMHVVRNDGSSSKLMRVDWVGNEITTTYDGKQVMERFCDGTVIVRGQRVKVQKAPISAYREATASEVAGARGAGELP